MRGGGPLFPELERNRMAAEAGASNSACAKTGTLVAPSTLQSLCLCFYPLLKCLKRFVVLLPGAVARVAEDLRTRAGLSLSYDAAGRREYRFPNDVR
jgi:hypothetical protein